MLYIYVIGFMAVVVLC